MKAVGVIVAGGQGRRMQNAVAKQYLKIKGRPILSYTLTAFDTCTAIEHIYLVIPQTDFDYCRQTILASLQLKTPVSLVAGGAERQASVYNGLAAVNPETEYVAIHDGVRPLIHPEMIATCIEGARQTGACILGVPLTDTLKQVNSEGVIETTLSRHSMWRAQTPQAFSYRLIRDAHETARQQGVSGTDDAELLEMEGHPIKIINGSVFNLKITTPDDLKLAEIIWAHARDD